MVDRKGALLTLLMNCDRFKGHLSSLQHSLLSFCLCAVTTVLAKFPTVLLD